MVLLHVKRGDESQFLLQAPGSTELEELTVQVARVYNARLKVQRVCSGAARRVYGWDHGVRAGAGPGEEWERVIRDGEVGQEPQDFLGPAGRGGGGRKVRFSKICKDLRLAGLEGDTGVPPKSQRSAWRRRHLAGGRGQGPAAALRDRV